MSTWSSLSAAAQNKATTLYQNLLSFWNNPAGVSALMGNIWHESGGTFDGRICENYTEADLDGYCQQYTDDVNDGTITRTQFENAGWGYGLNQWTYHTRRLGLYDYCFNNNYNNIGSNLMQTNYIYIEITGGYPITEDAIENATSNTIDAYTEVIELDYYSPADPSASLADRQQDAREIYNNLSGLPPIPPGPQPSGQMDILILKHFIDKNHKKGYII